jgi:hypothetical protein
MTTYYADEVAASYPLKELPTGVFAIRGEYTFAGEAAASVVQMVKVPNGATVLDLILMHAALGSSVTLSVGDAGSAARYISAVDANSSPGVKRPTAPVDTYTYTADDTIDLTTGGAAATGKVVLVVLATMDY